MSPSFTKTLPPSAYRAAVGGVTQRTPPSPHRRHPHTSAAIRAAAVDLQNAEAAHASPQRTARSPQRSGRGAAGREAALETKGCNPADGFLHEAMLEWERMQACSLVFTP